MKRIITLILAAVMCFSLAACDEKTIPKEEMLETAVEMDDFAAEMAENRLRAEEKYIGKNYLVTGLVSNIQENQIDVGGFTVTLPTEDIMKLSTGQKITVVGKIESLSIEESQGTALGNSYTETSYHGFMSNGYFVTDTFELNGTLTMYYVSLRDINGNVDRRLGVPEVWEIGLDIVDDNIINVYYHMEDEIPVTHELGRDVNSVQFGGYEIADGTKITVSAKVFWDRDKQEYVLDDAKLISVN